MWSITFVLLPKIEAKIENMTPIESTLSGSLLPPEPEVETTLSEVEQVKQDNKDIVRAKIETIRKRLALK
jgi:hypothetical protein